jgi:hypothetical protein
MPGTRYDATTKAKAVRLVREHAGDYPTQWAAIRYGSCRSLPWCLVGVGVPSLVGLLGAVLVAASP